MLLWPGRAIYLGPVLENDAHAHHAIQISIALVGALALQDAPDGPWSDYHAVATAPDQFHRIRCRGLVAQIYLDPESAVGRALRARMGARGVRSIEVDGVDSLSAELRAALAGERDEDRLTGVVDDVLRATAAGPSGKPIDPRVRKILGTLRSAPVRRASLGVLAGEVALSPSRFATLFRRDTGIPFRRYLLWLRLIDALVALSTGRTLTEAAHAADFADSAHLSRTFRRMFGMAPSSLRSAQVAICLGASGSPRCQA